MIVLNVMFMSLGVSRAFLSHCIDKKVVTALIKSQHLFPFYNQNRVLQKETTLNAIPQNEGLLFPEQNSGIKIGKL